MSRADIKLIHGDCMDYMIKMPDNVFDLAICDPPYGIGRHGGETGKHWKKYENKGWDNYPPKKEYFSNLFRVSKNQIIWGANYFTENIKPSMGWIYWDKGQKLTMSDGELAYTSFQRALRSVTINRCKIGDNIGKNHPTQKPIILYKWLLTNYAKEGDKILDTHGGSMSIAIACWDLKFDLELYEIDVDYFEAGKRRFENHCMQEQLF